MRGVGALMGVAGALLCTTGCDRGSDAPADTPETVVEAAPKLPVLTFPNALRRKHPDATAFLDQFLAVCLNGDYFGYRQLVSRAYTPESRERFSAIYDAVEEVEIELVEQVRLPRVPEPTYRVVTRVHFDEVSRARLREDSRRIAFLVFPEQDELRMAPAPTVLQPRRDDDEPATQTAPAETQPAVEYPWEEGIDG